MLPNLSAQSMIDFMTLNRLYAWPYFERHLNAASEAFTHLHDDHDDPYGELGTGGSWEPIFGMIHESPSQSDKEGH